ncbi:hypothetical protein Tco_0135082 [Tanacetum coccineum]
MAIPTQFQNLSRKCVTCLLVFRRFFRFGHQSVDDMQCSYLNGYPKLSGVIAKNGMREILRLGLEMIEIAPPLIIADLMKKMPNIPQRIEEDYHSIKDDIPLVSVYTTGNVLVQGMLISDAFLTEEIRATDDFKEHETVFMNVDVLMNQPKPVVSTQGTHSTRKLDEEEIEKMVECDKDEESYASEFVDSVLNDDVDDSSTRIEPGSHKEKLKNVIDDDVEIENETKDDEEIE